MQSSHANRPGQGTAAATNEERCARLIDRRQEIRCIGETMVERKSTYL